MATDNSMSVEDNHTQRQFELLREFADKLIKIGLKVLDFESWHEDGYYYSKCMIDNHTVVVRFYKVYSVLIDNKDFMIGCPKSSIDRLALLIKKFIVKKPDVK